MLKCCHQNIIDINNVLIAYKNTVKREFFRWWILWVLSSDVSEE
jgi:hypothetical protein